MPMISVGFSQGETSQGDREIGSRARREFGGSRCRRRTGVSSRADGAANNKQLAELPITRSPCEIWDDLRSPSDHGQN